MSYQDKLANWEVGAKGGRGRCQVTQRQTEEKKIRQPSQVLGPEHLQGKGREQLWPF